MHIHRIGDVTVLNDHSEIPGLGFLPINAFVLHAEQPVVIDSGLSTAVDPADVRGSGLLTPTATTPAVCGSSCKPRRLPGW